MITSANQARAIFLEAIEQPDADQRAKLINDACGGDEGLRERVQRLVRSHEQLGSFHDGTSPPATTASPLEPVGTQIGPYKLLQQIGEGGMGVVYMAEQSVPVKRRVALKIIKPGMDSRQVIARFEAERQALSLMDHPNIAKVFDAGTTVSGRPYFVMELVKGQPITEYCDEHHLTPRQRVELLLPVCQAIQHAHQKGIIHRDIKPTNILVAEYDEQRVPKVIDFGVAKATSQSLTEKTMFTGLGQLVGTLEYMSPEQAKVNQLDIDTRSDIYSLGVLLYELLTGSTPFDKHRLRSAGWDEMLRIIREEEPPKPSTRLSYFSRLRETIQNSDRTTAPAGASHAPFRLASIAAVRRIEPAKLTKLVRGELDWIVMKALDKDRSRRYETASALAADLQNYLTDEPVVACPPSAVYRFRKFARRHSRALLTATTVALAVLMTAAVSGALIWRANQDLQQGLTRERRSAYLQRIALAEHEWGANNLSRMESLLEQCPADLRGWEWRYLKRLRHDSRLPLRHDSAVLGAAFSPDGRLLATGTQSGVVRIWNAKTGQELRKWPAHEGNAPAVRFSPDGRRLATGSWDKTVKVWDVEKTLQGDDNDPLFQWEHMSRVWSIAFSPDGQRLASAGGRETDEKGDVKITNLSKLARVELTLNFSRVVRGIHFSPDGLRLATCGQDMVQIWDARTGLEQLSWRDPKGRFEGVAFSPDGRRLAAVGGLLSVDPDAEVKVWDARTGQEIFSLRGHVGGLRSVAFSPDGSRLASTGLDQSIKLWDAATGQEVLTLRGQLDNVHCVVFSADGHQLASGSVDHTLRIWDASPLDVESKPGHLTLSGHTGAVTDVAFHPSDPRRLVSAGTDGTVRVWDARSGQELAALAGNSSQIRTRVAYSSDGQRLGVVSAAQGAPIQIWDATSPKVMGSFRGQIGPDLCLAFSSDGRHLATAGFDFIVRIWETTTGKEVRSLADHTWPVFSVAFSPDGRRLASGSADTSIRIWDWTTGQVLAVLEPGHAGRVTSVTYSRDGKRLASASFDRTVKIWDAESGELRHDLSHASGVQCVAFDRDGPRLAWGSSDGTVTVWDGPGQETHTLRGHTSWVQGVAFSPDGVWIASASLDGTAKVWKAPPDPQPLTPATPSQKFGARFPPAEDVPYVQHAR